ncbi:hypothetical protein DFH09DRAFT_1318768 [Mycena vulgaris]|nr:hypothetical protein DFH09DRAFT_1318768 [Mycena vulgaris]
MAIRRSRLEDHTLPLPRSVPPLSLLPHDLHFVHYARADAASPRRDSACSEKPTLDTRLVRSICSRPALPLSAPIARPVPASLERRAQHPCDHQRRSLRKRSQSALTTPPAPLPLSLSRHCTSCTSDYDHLPTLYYAHELHAMPARIQDTVHTVGRTRSVDVGILRRSRRLYLPLARLGPRRVRLYAEVLLGPSQQTWIMVTIFSFT